MSDLDRKVAQAMGLKSVHNCEKWGAKEEWIDAGNLKRLKKGDVLRVLRKGQEYYSAFKFDGLLAECDYTYDGAAPFVWLEVGMATLGKIVYTRKDFTTGAVYADRGDQVELLQSINTQHKGEHMKDPEDEAFEQLALKQGQWEHTSGWRKRQVYGKLLVDAGCAERGCMGYDPRDGDAVMMATRDEVLEEVAVELETRFTGPFGRDTVQSFAQYIRGMKR